MNGSNKSFRDTAKAWTEIIQSVATIVAIVAGGWWFIAQGLEKPRIKLEHTVTARPLLSSPNDWLVSVNIIATNIGSTGVHLQQGNIRIGQVNPMPGGDLKKRNLKELWLEPGESDQAMFDTYIVPKSIKTIFLESSYNVPEKHLLWFLNKNLVWDFKSIADLSDSDTTISTHTSNPKDFAH